MENNEFIIVGWTHDQFLIIQNENLESFCNKLNASKIIGIVYDIKLEITSDAIPIVKIWEVCPFNIIETQYERDRLTHELRALLAEKRYGEIIHKLNAAVKNPIQ